MLRIGMVATFILLSALGGPACAGDEDDWVHERIRVRNYGPCDDWWNACERYRYIWRWTRRSNLPEVRVYADRDGYRGSDCRDFVVSTGEERYGRDRAKEAAEQSWMEEVRNKWGVRYMDLRNSRSGTWECGRSSTGNRLSEKTGEAAGRYLEQCVLRSRPCRAEPERVNKDKD